MPSVLPIVPEELDSIAAFVAHVIDVSVDASAEEKAHFVENTQKNLRKVSEAPSESVHLKCVSDGELLGVVLVRDCWNLCHLFVAPHAQGQGIGRMLVQSAMAACRGRSPRGSLVLNSSLNAVGFYRHLGFTEVPDAPATFRGVRFERPL